MIKYAGFECPANTFDKAGLCTQCPLNSTSPPGHCSFFMLYSVFLIYFQFSLEFKLLNLSWFVVILCVYKVPFISRLYRSNQLPM